MHAWVAMLLAAVLAGSAGALTLDLELISDNGTLKFTNFRLFGGGDITEDELRALIIDTTENGVEILAGITLEDGESGDFQVFYDVEVIAGPEVNGVTLFSDSLVQIGEPGDGGFNLVKVQKFVFTEDEDELIATLEAFNFEGDVNTDFASFDPQTRLTILDNIRISAAGTGSTASAGLIRNDFSKVPEPGTLMLVGMGLVGLGRLGSRLGRP